MPIPVRPTAPVMAIPSGAGGKGAMFTVVSQDGEGVLRVDGTTWGSLVNHGDYGNYHLRLEYRFSGVRHAPRLDQPENNGLLPFSRRTRSGLGHVEPGGRIRDHDRFDRHGGAGGRRRPRRNDRGA